MLSEGRRRVQQRLLQALAQTAAQGASLPTYVSDIVAGAPSKLYGQPSGYAGAAAAAARQWRRLLSSASSSGSSGQTAWVSQPGGLDGRGAADEEEQKPSLQGWLQHEQGLKRAEAEQYAPRLVRAYGGDEAAALAGLPATFAWCRCQGLTGLQAAKVLQVIAQYRRDNVVRFAETAQQVWQRLDSYVREHAQATAGGNARLNLCLADMLSTNADAAKADAAKALAMAPNHVAGWLEAVGQRLTRAQLGSLLAQQPLIVTSKPQTALAAMDWAAGELGATDLPSFFGRAPTLLNYGVETLQRNWRSLACSLQSAGLTNKQARQLVQQHPAMLQNTPETWQDAMGWLHQRFPEPEQLWHVVQRGPHLLCCPAERLRHHADCLQERLGWTSEQVSAFIRDYPQPFATVPFSKPDTAAKLLLLTKVVGLGSVGECIDCYSSYLKTRLESMAALYMLVLAGAPQMLRRQDESPSLSWIMAKPYVMKHCGVSAEEYNAYLRAWRASEEGQRLLAELRAGRTDSWPRPPPGAGNGSSSDGDGVSASPGGSSGTPGSSGVGG